MIGNIQGYGPAVTSTCQLHTPKCCCCCCGVDEEEGGSRCGGPGWWTMEWWMVLLLPRWCTRHTIYFHNTITERALPLYTINCVLKPPYTMTKRVLLLNLMDIKGLCEEGGARTHAVTKKSWQP